nr:hypothetical protein [Vibrio sp. qd031]
MLQLFIFGLGGRYPSQQHIEATVDWLNQMQPEQIAKNPGAQENVIQTFAW